MTSDEFNDTIDRADHLRQEAKEAAPNCPLKTGMRPCLCDLPRCPKCNYTKHDAAFEQDHRFCSGIIPPEDALPS